MKKIRCALIGPGNIGTDLLYKLKRSPVLEPVWMVGIDPTSDGLKRAAEMGMKVTADGVDGLLPHVKADNVQIAFDATSAYVHAENSRKLNALGVMMIDLTPAAIGPFCVPPVNLKQHVGQREMNVNMVTCGGQATIPMVAAVSQVQPVAYGEIVATVSSKSAGPGTRKNIDEFTRTTAGAIEKVRRRQKRQGHHHHQPGRAAADHARHRALPHRNRTRPGENHCVDPRHDQGSAEICARLPAGEWADFRRQPRLGFPRKWKAWATTCPNTPATWTS